MFKTIKNANESRDMSAEKAKSNFEEFKVYVEEAITTAISKGNFTVQIDMLSCGTIKINDFSTVVKELKSLGYKVQLETTDKRVWRIYWDRDYSIVESDAEYDF